MSATFESSGGSSLPPWVVAVIDDEPDVLAVSSLVLGDLSFDGRAVEIVCAQSAAEGRELFQRRADIAVALVDVVMENDRAGLDLIQHIRENLGNRLTRLILRTGQPGMAPEREIVSHFQIDDYKEKTELTADRLYTAVYAALRAYQALWILEQTRRGLSRITDAANRLMQCESAEQFVCRALEEACGLAEAISTPCGDVETHLASHRIRGLAVAIDATSAQTHGAAASVIFGVGEFAGQQGRALADVVDAPRVAHIEAIAREGGMSADHRGAVMQLDVGSGQRHALWVCCPLMAESQVSSLWQTYADKLRDLASTRRAMQARTEAAEAANRAKSQFLANVSHEIRTPLNAVLGMLKLLQSTPLNPRQFDYVSKTEGAARSLLLLLNDVLDFSKVEANKMNLDPRPFRIDQMLRELSVIFSASVGEKSLEVLFDIDPELPRILIGDDLRLHQILINLGGNAIKFTEKGEVVIGVKMLERTAEDVLVEFGVRDTGIGIAKDQIARIFTGFTQAESSTTRRYGGTGLGLAICERLVGLMGGRIEVDSELGAGSLFRFRIRLPIGESAGEEGLPLHEASVRKELSDLHVLVVDDNASARELLSAMAKSLGWTVDVADGGPQALEMARARAAQGRPYDVAFVDWQMPGMDGWETGLRLRHQGVSGSGSLVLMVTAHGREMLAHRSPREQAQLGGFLVKPVSASMLFDAVVNARLGTSEAASGQGVPGRSKRLQGLRLLVVEDNANNQQVAKELLESEGASVALAGNGRTGVDAVLNAKPAFDAVLMDVQMPVLDGFEATRLLRAEPSFRDLPIIAMTANAMSDDREDCLAAGMTDHVGKPFELSDLVLRILRHTGRLLASDTRLPSEALQATAILNPQLMALARDAGLDLVSALARIEGRVEILERLLQGFLRDLPEGLARIDAAIRGTQPSQAANELHTLKGLAGMLGIEALQAALADAEKRVRAELTPEARTDLLQALQSQVQRVLMVGPALHAALLAASPRPVAASQVAPTQAELRMLLEPLLVLLDASDMAAVESFEALLPSLGHLAVPLLEELEQAIHGLSFERAAAICRGFLSDSAASA